MKANVGDWSELYAFLRLVGSGQVFSADMGPHSLDSSIHPLKSVCRVDGNLYKYTKVESLISVTCSENPLIKDVVERSDFSDAADKVLEVLLAHKLSNQGGPIDYNGLSDFFDRIHIKKPKANSSNKSDIYLELIKPYSTINTMNKDNESSTYMEGFSVKSRLGGASTLFNASQSSSIEYSVVGKLSDSDIKEINDITTGAKIKARIQAIYDKGCKLKFASIPDDIFSGNLISIDSNFDKILGELVLSAYVEGNRNIVEICKSLQESNPLNYPEDEGYDIRKYYDNKVKDFLVSVALGMKSQVPWSGKLEVSGGYIVVKEDGDLVAYHNYDRSLFRDYLFTHTVIDTPSSTKHKFGEVVRAINGIDSVFSLGLQIRFHNKPQLLKENKDEEVSVKSRKP